MPELRDILAENPVIAAVRSDDDLDAVVKSRVRIVFVLYGNIVTLSAICERLAQAGKDVFVHVDLIDGLKGDPAGIEYVRRTAGPRGILSTKVNVVRYARPLGFETVLRVFILDSLSLRTGIKNIRDTRPDAVEVMPGVVCRVINDFEKQLTVPVIAGGLIVRKEQVYESLSAGAAAISTTRRELWGM